MLFNGQKRPNRNSGVDPVAAGGDFDPNTDRYFNPAAWTDPGPLQFGNAPRRDGTVRGFPTLQRGHQYLQGVPAAERHEAPVRAEFGNLFNRTLFCDPGTRTGAPAASARSVTQCNQPRSVQFALKFDF